jgi:hypothetical protein
MALQRAQKLRASFLRVESRLRPGKFDDYEVLLADAMRKRFQQTAVWLTTVAIFAGCSSSSQPTTVEPAQARLRMVASLYRQWTDLGRGAPAKQEQLLALARRDPTKWSDTAASPEELLASPRDNQPFVVAYGTIPKDSAETGFPWVAREKTGVDGKAYTVDLRGRVQLLDAQEISKVLPSPS